LLKSHTVNGVGGDKHLKITQTIPEQHIRKAQNQGTTENGHVAQWTRTAESGNIKVQNLHRGKKHDTTSTVTIE
jgi:hypothetical protein